MLKRTRIALFLTTFIYGILYIFLTVPNAGEKPVAKKKNYDKVIVVIQKKKIYVQAKKPKLKVVPVVQTAVINRSPYTFSPKPEVVAKPKAQVLKVTKVNKTPKPGSGLSTIPPTPDQQPKIEDLTIEEP